MAPHHGMPPGHLPVCSYLAVAVKSRSGEVLGGLFLGHPEPARFQQRDARLVEGVAAQAAIAIDNARLYESAQAQLATRERAEATLRDSDRRKDEFLATLAHELRNPLAPIRQAVNISQNPEATPAQKNWSHEVITRQVQHMSLLLDDLLDISRITRGTLELRRKRTQLAGVIETAIETARPAIDAKRHILGVHLPQVPVTLDVDPLRLSQVLSNLLTNAAKYTDPDGRLRIDAELLGGEVVIRVSDNGIGIAPEAMAELFTMFSQVRTVHDRSDGGLGIGLALSRGLIELHGGRLDAHSAGSAPAANSWCGCRHRRSHSQCRPSRRPAMIRRCAGGACWWPTTTSMPARASPCCCGLTATRWSSPATARRPWSCSIACDPRSPSSTSACPVSMATKSRSAFVRRRRAGSR
jgi:signal transduction histidine kinase